MRLFNVDYLGSKPPLCGPLQVYIDPQTKRSSSDSIKDVIIFPGTIIDPLKGEEFSVLNKIKKYELNSNENLYLKILINIGRSTLLFLKFITIHDVLEELENYEIYGTFPLRELTYDIISITIEKGTESQTYEDSKKSFEKNDDQIILYQKLEISDLHKGDEQNKQPYFLSSYGIPPLPVYWIMPSYVSECVVPEGRGGQSCSEKWIQEEEFNKKLLDDEAKLFGYDSFDSYRTALLKKGWRFSVMFDYE